MMIKNNLFDDLLNYLFLTNANRNLMCNEMSNMIVVRLKVGIIKKNKKLYNVSAFLRKSYFWRRRRVEAKRYNKGQVANTSCEIWVCWFL